MFHTRPKKMWDKMVISYHLMTLFTMQYIHLPDSTNHVSMLIHVKRKSVTVSMRKLDITNIDVKLWNHKNEVTQGNYLHSLAQPAIKIQKLFELTDIEYDF